MAGKQKSKKDKKKKGKKGDGSAIAAAIMPTAMLAAVPRTPPPPKDTQTETQFFGQGFNSNLLNSSLLGRMFATPGLEDDRHVTDTDTSLYDYDQAYSMATDPMYSSVEIEADRRLRDRRRIPTPEARTSAEAATAMYHELEEDAAQRSGNLEALYSMPIKKQDRPVTIAMNDTDEVSSSDNDAPPVSSSMTRFLRDDVAPRSGGRSLSFMSPLNHFNPKSLQKSAQSTPKETAVIKSKPQSFSDSCVHGVRPDAGVPPESRPVAMASNNVDDTDIISCDAATPPVSSSMKRFLRDDAKSLSDRRSLSFSSAINPSTNPKSLQRSESKQSSQSNPEVKQSVRYNPDSRKSKPADTVTPRKKKKAKGLPRPDPEVVNPEYLNAHHVNEEVLEDFIIPTDARQAESASALNSVRSQTAELSARQRALEQSLEAQLMEQRGSMRTTHSSLQSAHPELKAVIAKQNAVTEDTLNKQQDLIDNLQENVAAMSEENRQLQDINSQLHAEINRLKKQRHRSTEDDGYDMSGVADSVSYKEELKTLKSAAHRLNIELSRYQAKFRPLDQDSQKSESLGGLPSKGPIPSWLINTKYLAPLFLAYDDRLNEKELVIKKYEDELTHFSDQIEEIIKENERLHLRLEQTDISGPISMTEWKQLQEQAKLVLEENQLLMEQLDVHHNKARDMHTAHLHEVSKLSKKLVVAEAEKEELENTMAELRKSYTNIRQKHDTLVIDTNHRITKEDHITVISEMKLSIEEEREKHSKDMDNIMSKLQSLQSEKKSLGIQVTDLTTENKMLEAEIRGLQKAQKKAKRKILLLQKGLDSAENKEHAASHYLNSVIKMAEKTALERDTYAKVVDSKEREKHQMINHVMEGKVVVSKMEEKLRLYKVKASEKVGQVVERMKDLNSEFDKKRLEYDEEMKHLRLLLKEKDALLGQSEAEKSHMEENLEMVWQAAKTDNRRMQETLRENIRSLRSHKHLQPLLDEEEGGEDEDNEALIISCTSDHAT